MSQKKTKQSADVVDLNAAKAKAKGPKCPICGKPARVEHKPFCSKRCADIDLGKWLGEGYRIPTDEVAGFDDGYDGED